MIDLRWRIDDEDEDLVGAPRPLVSTWRYLRNALRRQWRLLAGLAALGGLLGLTGFALMPARSTGTATLLVAHPTNMEATSAMGTDVSLAGTRDPAARTVKALGLDEAPEDFQARVAAEPVTSEILTLSVSGPDDPTAVAWADEFTRQYLEFRATQMRALSSGLVNGYKTRISRLQKQEEALKTEYAQVSASGAGGDSRAAEILTQRAALNKQVADSQQELEDVTLQTEAAITSTGVVDQAQPVSRSAKRLLFLSVLSGVIGGAALGGGFIALHALTSERLRRRQDVAIALGAPVTCAVGGGRAAGGGLGRVVRRLAPRGSSAQAGYPGASSTWDLEALVRGLERALLPLRGAVPSAPSKDPDAVPPRASRGVAVAAIRNAPVAALVLYGLAVRLRGLGKSVFLVDLSESGELLAATSRQRSVGPRRDSSAPGAAPVAGNRNRDSEVFRPAGLPGLAWGPRGAAEGAVVELPASNPRRAAWDAADVVLALVEVDPGIEVEHLKSWVDQVVPLVTAGRSTAELLETTAELIRAAGLSLPFAMMVGSDRLDESLGAVSFRHLEPDSGAQRATQAEPAAASPR